MIMGNENESGKPFAAWSITATACPECGCTDVRKLEKSNKHSNGQWNERIEFACGLKLHYSPNFQRVDREDDCGQSDRAVSWKSQRKSIAKAMIEAAKHEAGKPDADLGLLLTRLRIDLDSYRDELEQADQ